MSELFDKAIAFMKRHPHTKIKDLPGASTESIRKVYAGIVEKLKEKQRQAITEGGRFEGLTVEQYTFQIKRYERLATTFVMPKKSS